MGEEIQRRGNWFSQDMKQVSKYQNWTLVGWLAGDSAAVLNHRFGSWKEPGVLIPSSHKKGCQKPRSQVVAEPVLKHPSLTSVLTNPTTPLLEYILYFVILNIRKIRSPLEVIHKGLREERTMVF